MVCHSLVGCAVYKNQYYAEVRRTSAKEAKRKFMVYVYMLVLLILLDIALVVYSLYLAFTCKNSRYPILQVVLALFFPLPYILYNRLVSECKNTTK